MNPSNFLSVNDLFDKKISIIMAGDIPGSGRYFDEDSRVKFFSLEHIINTIGQKSTKAQGLKKNITTLEKLLHLPTDKLYILKDEMGNGGAGEVIGILKIGKRRLFLYNKQNVLVIDTPTCILDFFVIENRQRSGFGKKLFDYMLEVEKVKPYDLAIDGPSPKMLEFLKTHYNFTNITKQSNNFVICDKFFDSTHAGTLRPVEDRDVAPHPMMRRWASEASSVIHGLSSSSSSVSMKSESESPMSEVDAETSEEQWEVAVAAAEPAAEPAAVPAAEPAAVPAAAPASELESQDPIEATASTSKPPERPSTLTIDCAKVVEAEANVQPESATSQQSDSQLTDQGYVDLKFHHKKLW